jgi:hypothetical protein
MGTAPGRRLQAVGDRSLATQLPATQNRHNFWERQTISASASGGNAARSPGAIVSALKVVLTRHEWRLQGSPIWDLDALRYSPVQRSRIWTDYHS